MTPEDIMLQVEAFMRANSAECPVCLPHHLCGFAESMVLAERDRCAKVDFTQIIHDVLKKHGKTKRLALHDLHVMHKAIVAAIESGEEPK